MQSQNRVRRKWNVLGASRRVSVAVCIGLALTLTATSAHAQLDEIIVTATKREASLQDIPIAVTAFSAEILQNSGVDDIREVMSLAPSFQATTNSSETQGATIRIRGIGTVGNNPGLESAVGVFIDGVYRSRAGIALSELQDIERIEVLRGPQGTLFGRNTSAGALNIITQEPNFDFGGTGEVTYGNFNQFMLKGSVTGPVISEKLAVRLSGLYVERDGFLKDVDNLSNPAGQANIAGFLGRPTGFTIVGSEEDTVSGDVNNRDRWAIKGQALFTPTDTISLRVIADYREANEDCCSAVHFKVRRGDAGTEAIDFLRGSPPDGFPPSATKDGTQFGNQFEQAFTIPSIGGLVPDKTGPDIGFPPFDRRITQNDPTTQNVEDWGVSAQLDWDLGAFTMTSITAYRDFQSFRQLDLDFTDADLIEQSSRDDGVEIFTQEVRFQGTWKDLDWLFGGFYSNEDITVRADVLHGEEYGEFIDNRFGGLIAIATNSLAGLAPTASSVNAQWRGGALAPVLFSPAIPFGGGVTGLINNWCARKQIGLVQPGIAPGMCLDANGVGKNVLGGDIFTPDELYPAGSGILGDFKQDASNWSIFTHNTWSATDKISITFGFRWTSETKEASSNLTGVGAQNTPFLNSLSPTGSAPISLGCSLLQGQDGNPSTEDGVFSEFPDNPFDTAPGGFNSEDVGPAPVTAINPLRVNDGILRMNELGTLSEGAPLFVSPSDSSPASFNASDTRAVEDVIGALGCLGIANGGFEFDDDRDENEATGTIKLSYQFTDDILGYASYSRGYKSGGFNLDSAGTLLNQGGNVSNQASFDAGFAAIASANPGLTTDEVTARLNFPNVLVNQFEPEFVNAYEVGLKSTLFDRLMTLNVALFWEDFSDFQLNTFNGFLFQAQNQDGVRSRGFEVESNLNPLQGLDLFAGVTFAETDYADGNVDAIATAIENDHRNNPVAVRSNLAGQQLTNAPRWVITAGGTYMFPFGATPFDAFVHADARYDSGYNTGSDLDPEKEQDGYTVINARIGLTGLDGMVQLEAWARNITDKNYSQVVFDLPLQSNGAYGSFLADPRTYGVTARFSF